MNNKFILSIALSIPCIASLTNTSPGSIVDARTFPAGPLYQTHVTYQRDSTTCGYRAKAYAHAIESLCSQNKTVSPQAIDKLGMELFAQINPRNNRQAEDEDLIPFEQLNTAQYHNIYIISKQGGTYVSQDINKPLNTITQKIKQINQSGCGCIHFICNQGNAHWVLCSYVKEPGKQPYMIYIDSKNNNLKRSSIYDCVQHLYSICFNTTKEIRQPHSYSVDFNKKISAWWLYLKTKWLLPPCAWIKGLFTRSR